MRRAPRSNTRTVFVRLLLLLLCGPAAFILSGCPDRHYNTELPRYPAAVEGQVRFPAGPESAVEGTHVVISHDRFLVRRSAAVKVGADGKFSFKPLLPGIYYLAAFRDLDTNETWTYGTDLIAGKIAEFYDLEAPWSIEVKEDQTGVVDPKLIVPFRILRPEPLSNGHTLNPKFVWESVPTAATYRIRIFDLDDRTVYHVETANTFLEYRVNAYPGDTILVPRQTLDLAREYQVTVTARRADVGVIGYAGAVRFRLDVIDPTARKAE